MGACMRGSLLPMARQCGAPPIGHISCARIAQLALSVRLRGRLIGVRPSTMGKPPNAQQRGVGSRHSLGCIGLGFPRGLIACRQEGDETDVLCRLVCRSLRAAHRSFFQVISLVQSPLRARAGCPNIACSVVNPMWGHPDVRTGVRWEIGVAPVAAQVCRHWVFRFGQEGRSSVWAGSVKPCCLATVAPAVAPPSCRVSSGCKPRPAAP